MRFKYLLFLFLTIFPFNFNIVGARTFDKAENNKQTLKALNAIILFLNTETQRAILFPSYLYKYNLEVENYPLKSIIGPSYFSSHKNYLLPESEYNSAIEEIKKLSKKNKTILKPDVEKIYQLIVKKQQLIIELHNYAKNKNYETDNFEKYQSIYKQLVNTINNYYYSSLSLYAKIRRIYNVFNYENQIKTKDVFYNLQHKLAQKIKLNKKIVTSFEWIKADSLVITAQISKIEIQIEDSISFFNSYLYILNSQSLVKDFKNLYQSDKAFEKYLYKLLSQKEKKEEAMEQQTRLKLLINETIKQYNNTIYEMETNFPLSFKTSLLQELYIPVNLVLNSQNILTEQLPSNQITLLIDASLSMGTEKKLQIFTQQFESIIQKLRNKDYIAIVQFSGKPKELRPLTSSLYKDEIIETLNSINIKGTTHIENGLKIAYNSLAEKKQNSNKRIILVSDGIFNITEKMYSQIEKQAKKGIKLSIIYLGDPENEQIINLKKLSGLGHGNFHQANSTNIKFCLIDEFSGQ